jgi:hypothetical protein
MKIADTEFNLITDIRTLGIQYSGKYAYRENVEHFVQLMALATAYKVAIGNLRTTAKIATKIAGMCCGDSEQIDFMLNQPGRLLPQLVIDFRDAAPASAA